MNSDQIIQRLCECGFKAHLTGGAPRDMLLGENPIDEDIVTDALPDDIMILFRECKISLVGVSFKVCIVDGIEVATYRADTYFGGSAKNCEVTVAQTIQEDLSRRDLSINSMAFCPYTGDLIDEFGGQSDLKNKIIRFTGDPEQRILEDPCRILRACRFLAKIEGTFDDATRQALKKYGYLVGQKVAPERIQKELIKLMAYRKPSLFFEACADIGILHHISPSMVLCIGFNGGKYHKETVFEHLMIVGDELPSSNPLLRLTGYWHDVGKPVSAKMKDDHFSFIDHEHDGADTAKEELRNLKFGNKAVEYIAGLIRHHMRSFSKEVTPKATRRMLKKFSDDGVNYRDWIRLKIADCKGNLSKDNYSLGVIRKMVNRIQDELNPKEDNVAFGTKDLAINGKDIMQTLNISPGPRVGKILKTLLDRVLDDPSLNNKETLTNLIQTL